MDIFSKTDFLEIVERDYRNVVEKEIKHSSGNEYNLCESCGIIMNYNHIDGYCCNSCGLIRRSIGEHRLDHSKSINTVQYMRVVGPEASGFQKLLYGCMIGNYEELRGRIISDEFKKKNMDNNSGFPPDVIAYAAQKFVDVVKHRVLRANVRQETMAACLADACAHAGINRRSKEIAAFMDLQKAGYAEGENVLRELYSDEKITLTLDTDPTNAFMRRYFELLNLDEKYAPFIKDIIDYANKRNVGLHSVASTKCAGAIYVLALAEKLPITMQQIDLKCNIRKNTFTKFYDDVVGNLRLFRPIFEKHNISLDLKQRKRNKKATGGL
jgi:hypothetical protein